MPPGTAGPGDLQVERDRACAPADSTCPPVVAGDPNARVGNNPGSRGVLVVDSGHRSEEKHMRWHRNLLTTVVVALAAGVAAAAASGHPAGKKPPAVKGKI